MTKEKFDSEVATLKKFFELHCHDKHTNQQLYNETLSFEDKVEQIELNLCLECQELLRYSLDRLQECPHDIKPRCRTCPTPCYEKTKWKQVAKLMKYSGMKLGLIKIRKILGLAKD